MLRRATVRDERGDVDAGLCGLFASVLLDYAARGRDALPAVCQRRTHVHGLVQCRPRDMLQQTSHRDAALRTVPRSVRTHTHTSSFSGPLSRTTRMSWYQRGETNLDFTEARDSELQWHQLGHLQVCTSLQTDNHASTPSCRPTNSVKALKAGVKLGGSHRISDPAPLV